MCNSALGMPRMNACITASERNVGMALDINLEQSLGRPLTRHQSSYRFVSSGGIRTAPEASYRLSGRMSTRPGPLKVEAAEMSGHVYHLSNEVEAGHRFRFHGLRGETVGIDPPEGHFGLVVAPCSGRPHDPMMQAVRDFAQRSAAHLIERLDIVARLAPVLRQALGQHFG